MNIKLQVIFWSITTVVLTLLFSRSLDGIIVSFYFVTFLLPIALATSVVFNNYLVPKFLLEGKRGKFVLYFIYLLIVSIYLEMLVMLLAFVILADYQFSNLGKIVGDIYVMAIVLYLIVFAYGFLIIYKKLQANQSKISELEEATEKNKLQLIHVVVDRKTVPISLDEITHIESLSDYIKIHTTSDVFITKEKISSIEKKLPTKFIRIHRSFIINQEAIQSFNREQIEVANQTFTIGRKYKAAVHEVLAG